MASLSVLYLSTSKYPLCVQTRSHLILGAHYERKDAHYAIVLSHE